MQDEVTKHSLKIYHTMKRPGKSFWEKLKEVIIEILIIVFAVTLSIWLHNWSDQREQQKETAEFLAGLKDDLAKDIQVMEQNRRWFVHVDTNFRHLEMLDNTRKVDTASDPTITHYLDFALRTTHPNIARYEGFKSTGKIATIGDDSLRQEILTYYQQTIPGINDNEDIVNTFEQQLMAAVLNKGESEPFRKLTTTFRIRALLELSRENLEPNINEYRSAQAQARKISQMIDKYLKAAH